MWPGETGWNDETSPEGVHGIRSGRLFITGHLLPHDPAMMLLSGVRLETVISCGSGSGDGR